MRNKLLKEIRIKKGLTQVEVAAYLDISQGKLSKIESGQIDLYAIDLIKLSKLYEVESKELASLIYESDF